MENLPEIAALLRRLSEIEGPVDEIDRAIVELLGYQRSVQYITLNQEQVKRVMWISPNGGDPSRMLRCTLSLEDAYHLMKTVSPSGYGGISWEPGMATAKLKDGRYWQAKTPEAALSMAVVAEFVSKSNRQA